MVSRALPVIHLYTASKTPASVTFSEADMNHAAISELLNSHNKIKFSQSYGIGLMTVGIIWLVPGFHIECIFTSVNFRPPSLNIPSTRVCLGQKQAPRKAAINSAKFALQYLGVYHVPSIGNCDGFKDFFWQLSPVLVRSTVIEKVRILVR